MKHLVSAACLAGFTVLATAAPVATSLSSGATLQNYQGSAAVNAGAMDADGVLWTVREQAHDGLQSWYVFFDPLNPSRLQATLDFGAAIVAVQTSRDGLIATQTDWQVDIDSDGLFDDYARRPLMGLEAVDSVDWTVGGSLLSIDWRADDPGDHIRVLVQAPQAPQPAQPVPEPASAALVLLALAAAGTAGRRRSS